MFDTIVQFKLKRIIILLRLYLTQNPDSVNLITIKFSLFFTLNKQDSIAIVYSFIIFIIQIDVYLIPWSAQENPSYLWTLRIPSISNDFSLFGCRFVLMKIDISYRHCLISSIAYPVNACTLWLFQICVFNSIRPSALTLQLAKKFLFWYFSKSRS